MVLVVAVGGAAGASIRVLALAVLPTSPGGFPWATLAANGTGAFLLGHLLTVLHERGDARAYAQPLLGTGLLGAYTTVSGVAVESGLLVRDGWWVLAGLYLAVTITTGLLAVSLGIAAARRLFVGRRR